jgi:hypothetical protein
LNKGAPNKRALFPSANGVPTGVEVVTALEQSIDIDVPRRKFVYGKPDDVAAYNPSSLPEAELDVLYKETPAADPLFDGIAKAWALNQINEDDFPEDDTVV